MLVSLRDSLLPTDADDILRLSAYNYVYGCSLYFFLRKIEALPAPSLEGIDKNNKAEIVKRVFEHLEAHAKNFYKTDTSNFVFDDRTKDFIGDKGIEVFEEVKKLVRACDPDTFWKTQEDFFKDSSVCLQRKT